MGQPMERLGPVGGHLHGWGVGAFGFCQKVLGVSTVAVNLYLGPLYGGLIAWWVLGEPMRWHHVMGAGLILPGICLASRR
jgi:drug/metabolite transporter (DMT)-like permease